MEPRGKNHVVLIGAPTDVGASERGGSMGPEALRVAGLQEALSELVSSCVDAGNVSGPPSPPRSAETGAGARHAREVELWCREARKAVEAALEGGSIPVLMGGDHSLAIGSLSAVARHCKKVGKVLRVVWLDAHADFNSEAMSPTGNIHGMPLAVLCGARVGDLASVVGADTLDPGMLSLVGLRSVDEQESKSLATVGARVFDMRWIDENGMRAAMREALAGLGPNDHLHVSFDVDFLDPQIAPGVGTRVKGGPTYREAQLCMEMLCDTGLVGSVDIMELNPAFDDCNMTAGLVVELMQSLFGKSTLWRPAGR
jgi:arginase